MIGNHGLTPRRERLYRSRNGFVLGVCRGLADYLGVPVFWVRTLALGLLLFSGLWPVAGIYLLAAVLMKPEPVLPPENDEEKEFYSSYAASPGLALRRLKRQYDKVDARLRRMEDTVTSKEYEWERKFRS